VRPVRIAGRVNVSKFNWFRLHPFNNKPDAVKVIVVVVAIFVAYIFWPSAAKAEETYLEVSPTILSGEYSDGMAFMLSEVWKDKYLLGFGVIGNQTCKCNEGKVAVGNNIMIQAQRLVRGPDVFLLRHTQMGMGLAYFYKQNRALGSNLTFGVMIAVHRPDRWWKYLPNDFVVRHYSNAGTATPNTGQDLYPMLRWVKSF